MELDRMLEALLWPIARTLEFTFNDCPRCILNHLSILPSLVTYLTVYGIAQAIGLVIVFGNTLLAALCTKVAGFVSGGDASSAIAGAEDAFHQPVRSFVAAFIYCCVFSVLFFFGYSMLVVMFEMATDFPTVRKMILGPRGKDVANEKGTQTAESDSGDEAISPQTEVQEPSPNALGSSFDVPGTRSSRTPATPANAEQEEAQRRLERQSRRLLVVVMPWMLMAVMLLVLVFIGALCEDWFGIGGRNDSFCDFVDAATRFNKNLRFVIVVVACQLLQAWLAIFPRWHAALARARFGPSLLLSLAVLLAVLPASILRLLTCLGVPIGVGSLPSEPRVTYFLDMGLLTGWSVWVLTTTVAIVERGVVGHAGFSITRLANRTEWRMLSAKFKLLLWAANGVEGVRGCLSGGMNEGINDLVSIGILYPLLFCIMWAVTFVAMRVSHYADASHKRWLMLCGFVGLLYVSRMLCDFAVVGGRLKNLPLLVLFVWLNISMQLLSSFRTWSRWFSSVRQAVSFRSTEIPQGRSSRKLSRAKTIKLVVNMRKSWEVRLAVVIFRALLIAVFTFCAVLLLTVVMASFQQKRKLYLEDIVWWRSMPNGVELTNAGASVLQLSYAGGKKKSRSKDANIPLGGKEASDFDYMLCGQTWHGLQLVDYALLSELPYVRDKVQNNLTGLVSMLMPHKPLRIKTVHSGGRRPWVEMELQRKGKSPLIIIAVSGTVLDRVSDYLEDIRMWTEPVILQILSILFPMTRAWPRETTALVFGSMQQLMAGLGVQDDEWHYAEILEYVRRLPTDREVVLTGHSLGGGIALVVGALTGRTAVALQPPGVYHSLAKHQAIQHDIAGLDKLHRKSMSLLVEGDMISHFDLHGGLVQTIPCDQKSTSIAAGCHLLEGSICHLLRHCGDQAQRFESCRHEFNPRQIGEKIIHEIGTVSQRSWHTFLTEIQQNESHIYSIVLSGLVIAVIAASRYGAPDKVALVPDQAKTHAD